MSNLMKILLIGWVFIFGVVACAPSSGQTPASSVDDSSGGRSESEGNPDITTNQVPTEGGTMPQVTRNYDDLEIVTLLPRDGIPAIDNPQFLSAEEADEEYAPDELVIGVSYDGDSRAYSIPFLSGHEIVNDTVGGRKISVTW